MSMGRALVRRYRIRGQRDRWRVEGEPVEQIGAGAWDGEDDAYWPTIQAGFTSIDAAREYVHEVSARQLALELDALHATGKAA